MRRFLFGLVGVLVVAVIGFVALTWRSELPAIAPRAAASFDPALVAKGADLAAIGNCDVCHTKPGGRSYAGGYPLETPFGVLYSTNITPDPDTGIGAWSQAAFTRAMRDGVDRGGRHLYPAFPFDHFTLTTDTDIAAIYAFLMTRQPVAARNEEARLNFPLNFRIFAAGWKLLFLHHDELKPDPSRDALWNRGRYLVSGLGHCGACHTPRNSLGAEKRGRKFAGGEGKNWEGPAFNASSLSPIPWTADQVFNYLRHGFDPLHGQVAGPMAPVSHNLARVPESDVRAIATYIASLNDTDAAMRQQKTQAALAFARDQEATLPVLRASTAATAPRQPDPPDATLLTREGAAIFAGACATCHHGGGEWPSTRPVPLGLSTTVHGPDARNLLHIVVDGIHPRPGESGKIMPGFAGALTDVQIVALAGYVRSRFSDKPPWTGLAEALQQIRRRPAVTEAP